jgi:hypothetical protein
MVSKWASIGNGVVAGVLISSATVMSAPLNAAGPVLAKQHVFTDWATACDNGGLCRAVSLQSESLGENLQITLTPSTDGKGALQIQFYPVPAPARQSTLSLYVDSLLILKDEPTDKDGVFTVSGAKATKLARMLARGKAASVRDEKGTNLVTASLLGATAAFRYMDIAQGKRGTRAAMIARGKRPYRSKMRALPVILAERPGTEDATPDVTALVALAESSACAKDRSEVSEDRAYSLGNGGGQAKALVLIACVNGAYNTISAAYIGRQKTDKSWQFEPAKMDLPPRPVSAADAPPLLANSEWDAAKRTLRSNIMSRGIGDCGLTTSYVWDGKMFRLVEAAGMEECRGAPDWLPLWRAVVKQSD